MENTLLLSKAKVGDDKLWFWIFFVLFIFSAVINGILAQTPNYIQTTTYKVETENPIVFPDVETGAVVVTYYDGLGKPIQEVAHQQAGNNGDFVTHIEYDAIGRQIMNYLPYVRESATLDFDPTAKSNTSDFYASYEDGFTFPFSEKEFENSSLNRITKQASPGESWRMGSDNEMRYFYDTNIKEELYHFTASSTDANITLRYNGKYREGHLYKTIIKDENWKAPTLENTVTEFTDKLGRTILKRRYKKNVPNQDPEFLPLDTYYIYDQYGNLTYVLPPKLSERIIAGNNLTSNYQELLEALGYQYIYDYRNRLIVKKLPGRKNEYIGYDLLDQVIATGPSLSPFGDESEGWLRTKYDAYGRVVYTMWKAGPVNINTLKTLMSQHGSRFFENRSSSPTTINGVVFDYSNLVKPTSGYHVLAVNYYDDYKWGQAPSSIPNTVCDGESDVDYGIKKMPKGLPTGNWTRILTVSGSNRGKIDHLLYAKKSRVVRMHTDYPEGGYTTVDNKFNFIGHKLKTITRHRKDRTVSEQKIDEEYTYNSQMRQIFHFHQMNNDQSQLISKNSYNVLGQLSQKSIGGSDLSGAMALQKADYKYNIRGWLTQINNVDDLYQSGAPADLFAFKINYDSVEDDINREVKPLFNGNIAETSWRTINDNIKRRYGYSYDGLNRITAAFYQRPDMAMPRADSYSTSYSYDSNGNLLTLKRNGQMDGADPPIPIDDLFYRYDVGDVGNQLQNVFDREGHPDGYKDDRERGRDTPDFKYDDYGNLVLDNDKKISKIFYNHLNLPTKIIFSGRGEIVYIYDASGVKLEKVVTEGTTIATTNYMDGFIYKNSKLNFFPHAEGYVQAKAERDYYTFDYVYNYTDIWGNVRLSYSDLDLNGAIDPNTEILKERNYYPFGLLHKGYNNTVIGTENNYKQYQGQEYTEDLGLNTHEWKYRVSDPAIGRFWQIDPLAEDYVYNSTYAFQENKMGMGRELEGLELAPINPINMFNFETKGKPVLTFGLHKAKLPIAQRNEGGGIGAFIENTAKAMYNGVASTFNDGMAGKDMGQITDEGMAQMGDTVRKIENGEGTIEDAENIVAGGAMMLMRGGRGKNKLKPNKDAVGDHSSFDVDVNGNVYKYETYKQTSTGHFDPQKRFDGGTKDGGPGAPHRNKATGEDVNTPHVQGKTVEGGARKPTPDELPNNDRFNNNN